MRNICTAVKIHTINGSGCLQFYSFTELGKKADKENVIQELAGKADKEDVKTELSTISLSAFFSNSVRILFSLSAKTPSK